MNTFLKDQNGVRVSYVGHVIPASDDISFILREALEYADLSKKELKEIVISKSEYFDTASAFFVFGPDDKIIKRFAL